MENLNTYYGYKTFLDELRDPEVKEAESIRRKEKLEMKR